MAAILVATASLSVAAGAAVAQPLLTDALYRSHHPRLLFRSSDVPGLVTKVHDGGPDDDAYAFIRDRVQTLYPTWSDALVLGTWYGLESLPDIALVGHLESPPDAAAIARGKSLTTFIADTYEPDFDEAGSSERLRSLAIGYDLFFDTATPDERGAIRDEIVHYLQVMTANPAYQVFELRPYLANHSAMIASALGLAAIDLQGEADQPVLDAAMAMADRIVANLLQYQFDPGGAYNEGSLYALWGLKHLAFYFEARKRFDGTNYADNARLRAVEEWLAYELLPEGGAHSQNLNDSGLTTTPFARNSAYFDWAMHAWNSGLSAWLWDHSVGTYGIDFGGDADKAATVLWHAAVPVMQPAMVLPLHRIWLQRGLYEFRTGWPTGASSDDVVFSFYSGKFEGGHAQEDQNQFALYGYGAQFVVDHGSGSVAKQSEAHNMVFIDGKGQHNAGSSIGTDGRIADYLLGGIADYVEGDAARAYTTYSEFNAPNVPVAGSDWSWGYQGANPVQTADRRVLVVHGASEPPYVVVMDDIDKDGGVHTYEWRMHTLATNTVDTAGDPMTIATSTATMDLHLLNPPRASVTVSTETFAAGNGDPNSTLLRIATSAVNPGFAFLMMPRSNATTAPPVANVAYPWGDVCTVDWPGSRIDYLVRNDSGAAVTAGTITTDARIAVVRLHHGRVEGYLAVDASALTVGSTACVAIENGTATCEESGSMVNLNRYDANFRFYDMGITSVYYHDQALGFVKDSGYIVPGGTTGVGNTPRGAGAIGLSVFPNPFNPATTIRVDADPNVPVRVTIFDVAGRRVYRLWDGPLLATTRSIEWDGRTDSNARVASGTYFVRATTPSGSRTVKLTLLK
jgi:Heparinase II/III-like protein/FlgD Ig-like domain